MTTKTYRAIGITAALGAAAIPFLQFERINEKDDKGIVGIIRLLAGETPNAANVLFWMSLALQVVAIVLLLANRKGAETFGARTAQAHAFLAVAISIAMVLGVGRDTENVFVEWGKIWCGGRDKFAPLAILLLLQWACLRKSSNATPQQIWRGVSIACIAFCTVLGLLTFAYNGEARFFISPDVTFFNIGVLCHVLAIVLIYARPNRAWLWSGIIGLSCLTSGLILTNPPAAVQGDVMAVGWALYVGWYLVAPYLPIIAYALASISAVRLFQIERSRVNQVIEGASLSN